MLTDPLFYAVAIPAVILTGLSKGGFSGVSMAALPLMALVVSPIQAAAIMLPVLMTQDVFTVWSYRKTVDRVLLGYILPPAMIGIALAWATAALVSESAIRLIVGSIAVAFCLETWLGRRPLGETRPHSRPLGAVLGATSGFTSFLVNAGGAPFIAYALPRTATKERLAGSAAIHFWVVNIVKLPAFLALGQITRESLALSAALLPIAIAANLAGIWLVRRISAKAFFSIILWVTFLIGLKLIADAVRTLG
jgi:hypothetical protein